MRGWDKRAYDAWVTREPPEPRCPKCRSLDFGFDEEHGNVWRCEKCGYEEKEGAGR